MCTKIRIDSGAEHSTSAPNRVVHPPCCQSVLIETACDQLRSKPYWATGIEMHARAFESYVVAKLANQNGSNDDLANIVDGAYRAMDAEVQGGKDAYSYLYLHLYPAERPVVRAAFDRLLDTIQTCETDIGVEMCSWIPDRPAASLQSGKVILGEMLHDRQKAAIRWYRSDPVGTEVVNDALGITVGFNGVSAKNTASRMGDDVLSINAALPETLARATLVDATPDSWGRPNVEGVIRLRALVDLDNRTVPVFVTMHRKADGNIHYSVHEGEDVGDRAMQPPAEPSLKKVEPIPALEGDTDAMKLELGGPEVNLDGNARAIVVDLQVEMTPAALTARLRRPWLAA